MLSGRDFNEFFPNILIWSSMFVRDGYINKTDLNWITCCLSRSLLGFHGALLWLAWAEMGNYWKEAERHCPKLPRTEGNTEQTELQWEGTWVASGQLSSWISPAAASALLSGHSSASDLDVRLRKAGLTLSMVCSHGPCWPTIPSLPLLWPCLFFTVRTITYQSSIYMSAYGDFQILMPRPNPQRFWHTWSGHLFFKAPTLCSKAQTRLIRIVALMHF